MSTKSSSYCNLLHNLKMSIFSWENRMNGIPVAVRLLNHLFSSKDLPSVSSDALYIYRTKANMYEIVPTHNQYTDFLVCLPIDSLLQMPEKK